jgi:hypothetical protein
MEISTRPARRNPADRDAPPESDSPACVKFKAKKQTGVERFLAVPILLLHPSKTTSQSAYSAS